MSGEEFAGVGWAPGEVRGARSFKVDKIGRLTGVTYEQVWVPGENQAECRKSEGGAYNGFIRSSYSATYTFTPAVWSSPVVPVPVEVELKEPEKPLQHSFETCACGFYGYYDGSNDYQDKGRVSGVVQGYGETLIGTRGFRCMKARIVALRIPKSVPVRLAQLVARNYPDIPLFTSFNDMVAEFPPDGAGMEITPQSDPKFWTRSL